MAIGVEKAGIDRERLTVGGERCVKIPGEAVGLRQVEEPRRRRPVECDGTAESRDRLVEVAALTRDHRQELVRLGALGVGFECAPIELGRGIKIARAMKDSALLHEIEWG